MLKNSLDMSRSHLNHSKSKMAYSFTRESRFN